MARRRTRRVAEQSPLWEASLPDFASTWEEIERAVERNSIQRGAFILRNLAALSFEALLEEVEALAESYDRELWFEQAPLASIDSRALEQLEQVGIPYPYYFCLPDVLLRSPHLVLYYRNVAMVSQKVMSGLGLNTMGYELGLPLSDEAARELCEHFNTIVSGLLLLSPPSPRRHLELAYTNLGDSLGGSWRNEVGRLAYVEVLTPLVLYLHPLGAVESIQYRLKGAIAVEGEEDEASAGNRKVQFLNVTQATDLAATLARLEEQRLIYRKVGLKNGHRLEVNRQITWLDAEGQAHRIGPDLVAAEGETAIAWAGELKGGADPAGSDEHWKTATRAFARIREASERTQRPTPALSFIATIIVERVAREAALLIEAGQLHSVHKRTQVADDPARRERLLTELAHFLGYPGP